MILRSLRLHSFRAHGETELQFAPKVNLIHGPNGVGKTNVLEAIHYLCLTKSFVASRDKYALRKDAPYFQVEGTFDGARRSDRAVRLVYVPGEGKEIFVNGAPLERLAEIVGQLPVVVFSPQDHALTAEGPSERRRFLDNILSQAHPVYLDNLMKYRRARRQRNELLKQYRKQGGPPAEVIEPWTEELVLLGSHIIARRRQFLDSFAEYLQRAYRRIETVAERPTIEYDTIAGLDSEVDEVDAIAEALREALERTREGERKRGTTLVGPQRDELIFRLDGLEVRRYGSQGQHRTFGMALKLAKYFYLHDRLDEYPLLLLDDAFGKLDEERSSVFLELLMSDDIGQSFVTATHDKSFREDVPFQQSDHRAIHLEHSETEAAVVASH